MVSFGSKTSDNKVSGPVTYDPSSLAGSAYTVGDVSGGLATVNGFKLKQGTDITLTTDSAENAVEIAYSGSGGGGDGPYTIISPIKTVTLPTGSFTDKNIFHSSAAGTKSWTIPTSTAGAVVKCLVTGGTRLQLITDSTTINGVSGTIDYVLSSGYVYVELLTHDGTNYFVTSVNAA